MKDNYEDIKIIIREACRVNHYKDNYGDTKIFMKEARRVNHYER